jgi:hypothetical protein
MIMFANILNEQVSEICSDCGMDSSEADNFAFKTNWKTIVKTIFALSSNQRPAYVPVTDAELHQLATEAGFSVQSDGSIWDHNEFVYQDDCGMMDIKDKLIDLINSDREKRANGA